jgi:thioredoxin
MKQITNHTELEQLVAGNKPVVIDFYADWCGPCRALLPILEAVSDDRGDDVVIAKVNVDHNPDLATEFGVTSIPRVFLMKEQKIVDQFTGVKAKSDINKRIENLISATVQTHSH